MKLVISDEEYANKVAKLKKTSATKGSAAEIMSNSAIEQLNNTYIPYYPGIDDPENKWGAYEAKGLSKAEKASFVYYFCGYLQYYDYVVRGNFINHALYFHWNDKEGEVVVYIDPKPVREIIKPSIGEAALTAQQGSGVSSDPVAPKSPPPPYP